ALLDRPVRIDRIRVNPYALSIEARGFAITEKDGAPLVGFDRLFIDLETKSLLRWAWTFGEITLENPAVELIRFVDGDSNLGRLIPPADPATGPEDDGAPLPRLSVEVLSITGGTLGIRDETVPEPFVTRLAPIDFRLDGI